MPHRQRFEMLNENTDPALAALCERISLACALAVGLLGAVVLTGWLLDISVLKGSLAPGGGDMKPNAAFGMMLAGASLVAALRVQASSSWRVLHLACGAMVALLGLTAATEHLLRADLGIDRLLLPAPADSVRAPPLRMALTTAVGFVFTGAALLLIDGRARAAGFYSALLGSLLGVLALMGYAFSAAELYGGGTDSAIALPSALALVAINLGVLHARPLRRPIAVLTSNTTGGVMARRLFPLVLTAPLLIGWLCVQGRMIGLYGPGFEIALISLTYVVLIGTLVWRTAEGLRHADQQRLAAERERSQQQAQLTGIIESARDAIVMLDASHRIVVFNPAAEAMFGRGAAQMQGAPIDVLVPERFRESHSDLLRAFAGDNTKPDGGGTVAGVRANGDEFPIEATIFRVDVQGEHYLTAILRDITARRDAERVTQAARAAAERANNAKSRFLAAASHDLRQPLSALTLYLNVLDDRLAHDDRPLLANMKACTNSLSALLTDLLDLSKLEAGVVTPNPSTFPVAELLANDVSVHGPEAERKGLRLHCRSSSWVAHTDRVLFKRILGNLIDNAVRYTDHGGVVVACRRRLGKTWVEVWDTGIGIAADKTSEIFEEFRQLGDEARTRGSGLGLAIVAKTAALLGLEIRVCSRPGRGSMFAIELPLGEQSLLPPVDVSETLCRPLRIALVEDNEIVREALCSALVNAGHDVLAAADGAELRAGLSGAWVPEVVVTDYRLARGETGFDVITGVRDALGVQFPALVITGDTDPTLMRSMAEHGITVLHKPIDLETLQAHLEDLTYDAAAPTAETGLRRLA